MNARRQILFEFPKLGLNLFCHIESICIGTLIDTDQTRRTSGYFGNTAVALAAEIHRSDVAQT